MQINKKNKIRKNSSNVGGIPNINIPKAVTNNPNERNKIVHNKREAKNFPVMTKSRGIGCAIIRDNVPLFLSIFILHQSQGQSLVMDLKMQQM